MARLLLADCRGWCGPRRAVVVFVGGSINLEMIMSNPTYGLAGRALEALVLLVAVLIATILLLVWAQGMVLAGAQVLAVGVVDWGRW